MKPVELIQNLFAAFGRGGIATVIAHIAPECRWTVSGKGIPAAGVYLGPPGVAGFFRIFGETEQVLRFEPREYFTAGENVVALGFEEIRAIATGKPASTGWAMLFRVRDGRVTYYESFYDTAAYARAHQAAGPMANVA